MDSWARTINSYWHTSVETVSHSLVGATLSLAGGGLIAATLSTFFGRLPVLFWLMVISFATAAWCAGAQTIESFLGARIMNSLFDAVALVVIATQRSSGQRIRELTWPGRAVWCTYKICSSCMSTRQSSFYPLTLQLYWPVPQPENQSLVLLFRARPLPRAPASSIHNRYRELALAVLGLHHHYGTMLDTHRSLRRRVFLRQKPVRWLTTFTKTSINANH